MLESYLEAKLGGAALLGVGAIGAFKDTPGQMIDLANETAFSNENADQAFVGSRGLSPGTVFDSTLGSGAAVGGTALGGALGMAGGAAVGGGIGSLLRETSISKDVNMAENFAEKIPLIGGKKIPLIGGKNILKAGKGGSMRAKAMLGVAGAVVGGAFGASAYTRSYVNRNRDFFQQNPYNRGSAMQAASTAAYGDIVLGMHNTRRG